MLKHQLQCTKCNVYVEVETGIHYRIIRIRLLLYYAWNSKTIVFEKFAGINMNTSSDQQL